MEGLRSQYRELSDVANTTPGDPLSYYRLSDYISTHWNKTAKNLQKSSSSGIFYIYYHKEVYNQLRVFLCIIDFKLLQTLKGYTDQCTIFRGCFLHDLLQFL